MSHQAQLSPVHLAAIHAACSGRIHAPATGGHRKRGGEVDNIVCFNSRTLKALAVRGMLVESHGGYLATDSGRKALPPRTRLAIAGLAVPPATGLRS